MHGMNCNCPKCRAASGGFGLETFGPGEAAGVLSEQAELELAMELLNVQTEQELEQFLGDVFSSVRRGLSAVGSFAKNNVLPVVGGVLKQAAKAALPIAGGALGSLIPIPGVGTALGSALGSAVAGALELEVAGLDREDADLERARRFVRFAASAIRDAANEVASASPASSARSALVNAALRTLPAAAGAVAAALPTPGRSGAWGAGAASVTQSGTGTWRRHGHHIIVQGL